MPSTGLFDLPFELVLKISQHLDFSDIWYLGTCSHSSRKLSYQLLQSQYQIDLIKPRIINPFGQSIHAAVAYLTRHGKTESEQQQYIIQSVANHLAIGIYDRMPSRSGRAFSLDFLLNKSLAILLEHCLFDSTLYSQISNSYGTDAPSQKFDHIISSIRTQQLQAQQQLLPTQNYTGVILVDFLATLEETLAVILEEEDMVHRIYHRLLTSHLQQQLRVIRSRYQSHHTDQSSYSEMREPSKNSKPSKEFRLYIKLVCSLAQTSLISCKDLENLAYHQMNYFFLTRPSDVSFSTEAGFKIFIRHHNEYLSIINTVTHNKRPAYHYQWKLWLEETQLRLGMLLDLLRAMIQKNYSQGDPPDFVHITAMLQETISALTLSETVHQNDPYAALYEIPIN
ncbi:hypothetical protein [Parasitella parasitica]|uniref:F-box domain-containing protein n=1 Tax=Parasitella parasitica TaxID=35722 RepID=A0A0B7MR62_9FUNG|nr:hypothetical protein [Parasitella parasitica]